MSNLCKNITKIIGTSPIEIVEAEIMELLESNFEKIEDECSLLDGSVFFISNIFQKDDRPFVENSLQFIMEIEKTSTTIHFCFILRGMNEKLERISGAIDSFYIDFSVETENQIQDKINQIKHIVLFRERIVSIIRGSCLAMDKTPAYIYFNKKKIKLIFEKYLKGSDLSIEIYGTFSLRREKFKIKGMPSNGKTINMYYETIINHKGLKELIDNNILLFLFTFKDEKNV